MKQCMVVGKKVGERQGGKKRRGRKVGKEEDNMD